MSLRRVVALDVGGTWDELRAELEGMGWVLLPALGGAPLSADQAGALRAP